MTKEEFKKKLESDASLRKAFEDNAMKVIQENNVELSEEELENLSGGFLSLGLKITKKDKKVESTRIDDNKLPPLEDGIF